MSAARSSCGSSSASATPRSPRTLDKPSADAGADVRRASDPQARPRLMTPNESGFGTGRLAAASRFRSVKLKFTP
jgi:hypothetical protein